MSMSSTIKWTHLDVAHKPKCITSSAGGNFGKNKTKKKKKKMTPSFFIQTEI